MADMFGGMMPAALLEYLRTMAQPKQSSPYGGQTFGGNTYGGNKFGGAQFGHSAAPPAMPQPMPQAAPPAAPPPNMQLPPYEQPGGMMPPMGNPLPPFQPPGGMMSQVMGFPRQIPQQQAATPAASVMQPPAPPMQPQMDNQQPYGPMMPTAEQLEMQRRLELERFRNSPAPWTMNQGTYGDQRGG